jgi:ABC-type sugar transport system substrate-binding protein
MNSSPRPSLARVWRAILHGVAALSLFMIAAACHAADPLRVTFVNPGAVGNPFWDQFTDFMQVVARDLGMQLEVRYANNNRYAGTGLALEALRQQPKPDWLIFLYQVGQGMDILAAAEQAKVYSFVLNTDVNADDRPLVGKPREKFKYWIGHMLPDDVAAGRELATRLIEAAKAKGRAGKDGRIHMLALNGGRDTTPGLDRAEGLHQALTLYPDVTALQGANNWDRQLARYQAGALFKRDPDISVVWAATDGMALGAVYELETKGRKAGVDILAGGINWTTDGIRAVRDGKLLASMGGHFMDGGWALVYIYDFAHGIDFGSKGTTIRSRMQAITQDNVEAWYPLVVEEQWQYINFRQFSKALNPQLRDYDFSLPAILKASRKS